MRVTELKMPWPRRAKDFEGLEQSGGMKRQDQSRACGNDFGGINGHSNGDVHFHGKSQTDEVTQYCMTTEIRGRALVVTEDKGESCEWAQCSLPWFIGRLTERELALRGSLLLQGLTHTSSDLLQSIPHQKYQIDVAVNSSFEEQDKAA